MFLSRNFSRPSIVGVATIFGLLLLSPLKVVGQDTARATVSGRVLDAVSGLPISNAEIECSHPTVSTFARTGAYALLGLTPGRYALTAKAPGGYVTSTIRLTLKVGEVREGIDFLLQKASSVSGVVRSDEGQPLAGLQVNLATIGYRGRIRGLTSIHSAITSRDGKFTITGVRAGHYYLHALSSAFRFGKDGTIPQAEGFYRSSYYPNSRDIDAASTIVVAAGEQLEGLSIIIGSTDTFCIKSTLQSDLPGPVNVNISDLAPDAIMPFGVASVTPKEEFSLCGLPRGDIGYSHRLYVAVRHTLGPRLLLSWIAT